MKIFISADIEGVTGVTHWDETDIHKPDHAAFQEQMTAEVAAACEGALQAGATEIWVKDAHGSGRNLVAAKLPQAVRLIRGWSGHPFQMLQELDKSFTAVLMVGYHSPSGEGGNPLSHTLTGWLAELRVNGQRVSEFLLNAYIAGLVNVPVVFVSGDKGLCDEVQIFNPSIVTVPVKEGIGNSTVSLHPHLALSEIREKVAQALQGDLEACRVVLPRSFRVELRYKDHYHAYRYSFYPGAVLKDACTVELETNDYFDVLRWLLFTT